MIVKSSTYVLLNRLQLQLLANTFLFLLSGHMLWYFMLIFKTNNKRIKLSSPDRRSVSNKEVKSSLQSLTLPSGAEIWYPLSVFILAKVRIIEAFL